MITYQPAILSDLYPIAQLHAKSWQLNYKGILSNDYLENKVHAERKTIWSKRLQQTNDNQYVITAKENSKLCGFVCVYSENDPKYGALLDNLHVSTSHQGRGIGKYLMALAGAWVHQQHPEQGMYLWVFASNIAARKFYERIGGQYIETIPYELMDGSGNYGDTARYYWEETNSII